MSTFILFCKSYQKDVLRVKRLLNSIVQFNIDRIPFYLSVPQKDLALFKDCIDWDRLALHGDFYLITDEVVVLSNPQSTLDRYYSMPGYLSQQVIKAEVWRYVDCNHYLCLDSEAEFRKSFYLRHFMKSATIPFSLMHLNSELLTLAKKLKKNKVIDHFYQDNHLLMEEFGRLPIKTEEWDFGPAPLIWSKSVWQSLDDFHLKPKNQTIWDAIERLPFEIRWYGEALLKFKAIPIHPIGPLFQVIHYDWQVKHLPPVENTRYLGILSQSNWDKDLDPDFARKSYLSRLWRQIKRLLKRAI